MLRYVGSAVNGSFVADGKESEIPGHSVLNGMPLRVYRRHSEECPERADRYNELCGCPRWAQYCCNGKVVRKSLKTRSWDEAKNKAQQLEFRFRNERENQTAKQGLIQIFQGQCAIRYCASAIMIAAAVGSTCLPLCACSSLMNAW